MPSDANLRRVPGHRRDDATPARVATGVSLGLLQAAMTVALAALVFVGDLRDHLDDGVVFALFGAAVVTATVSGFATWSGTIGAPQGSAAAVTALMATAAVREVAPAAALPTVLAVIAGATVLTGLAVFALGAFRLGHLVRFLPFPVVGGFLAGTGWLVLRGAVDLMVGESIGLDRVGELAAAGMARMWLPGLAFGVALAVGMKRIRSPVFPTGILVAAVGVFYAVAGPLAGSVEELRSGGWLIGPFEAGGWGRVLLPGDLTGADWSAVFAQGGRLATLGLITVMGLLVTLTSLELDTGGDADIDRELKVAGGATVLSGFGGGFVGYHHLALTRIGGADESSRLPGLTAALVCVAAVLLGRPLLEMLPRLVLGGLLVAIGLELLHEWIVVARRRLPVLEYGVIVLITVVIAAVGFIPGVAVGIAAALVVFVVNYSRTEIVRHELSGAVIRSRAARPAAARERLAELGDEILILELTGFMFFGSADRVVGRVKARLRREPPLRWLIIDFRQVRGVDASAVSSFVKLQRIGSRRGFRIVLTGLDRVRASLERGGVELNAVFPDVDRGLEWCEDEILHRPGVDAGDTEAPGEGALAAFGAGAAGTGFDPFVERLEVRAGDVLAEQGSAADAMYLVESGGLTVRLDLSDGNSTRLGRVGPGSVVGEVGLYTEGIRSASVVAVTDAVVLRISRESLAEMEEEAPELAAAVHRFVANLVSSRLAADNATIRALLD